MSKPRSQTFLIGAIGVVLGGSNILVVGHFIAHKDFQRTMFILLMAVVVPICFVGIAVAIRRLRWLHFRSEIVRTAGLKVFTNVWVSSNRLRGPAICVLQANECQLISLQPKHKRQVIHLAYRDMRVSMSRLPTIQARYKFLLISKAHPSVRYRFVPVDNFFLRSSQVEGAGYERLMKIAQTKPMTHANLAQNYKRLQQIVVSAVVILLTLSWFYQVAILLDQSFTSWQISRSPATTTAEISAVRDVKIFRRYGGQSEYYLADYMFTTNGQTVKAYGVPLIPGQAPARSLSVDYAKSQPHYSLPTGFESPSPLSVLLGILVLAGIVALIRMLFIKFTLM